MVSLQKLSKQENIWKLSKLNTFNPKNHYIPHYWSDKDFKVTVVNRALSSFHGGSLEVTFLVLLNLVICSYPF